MTQVDKSVEKLNNVLDQLDTTLESKLKAHESKQPDLFGGGAANTNEQSIDKAQLATVTEYLDRTIERVETLLKEGA